VIERDSACCAGDPGPRWPFSVGLRGRFSRRTSSGSRSGGHNPNATAGLRLRHQLLESRRCVLAGLGEQFDARATEGAVSRPIARGSRDHRGLCAMGLAPRIDVASRHLGYEQAVGRVVLRDQDLRGRQRAAIGP